MRALTGRGNGLPAPCHDAAQANADARHGATRAFFRSQRLPGWKRRLVGWSDFSSAQAPSAVRAAAHPPAKAKRPRPTGQTLQESARGAGQKQKTQEAAGVSAWRRVGEEKMPILMGRKDSHRMVFLLQLSPGSSRWSRSTPTNGKMRQTLGSACLRCELSL